MQNTLALLFAFLSMVVSLSSEDFTFSSIVFPSFYGEAM